MHKSFEILLINISTVRLSNSAMQRYWKIASLYQKFIVFIWNVISVLGGHILLHGGHL